MTARVSISRRTAEYFHGALNDVAALAGATVFPPTGRAADALRDLESAMAPRKFVRAARARKAVKKKTKKDETSEVRTAVMWRALGVCESCLVPRGPLEMDHFFGRVRVKQSAKNCWALCRACHRQKTDNKPSAAFWLGAFVAHAEKHGYTSEARAALNRLEAISMRAAK